VVEPYPSEKSWSSSVGMMTFLTEWKVIKNSMVQSPPTSGISAPMFNNYHRNIIGMLKQQEWEFFGEYHWNILWEYDGNVMERVFHGKQWC